MALLVSHLDKVLKQNGTGNGIMGAVDKQQLYLTPYGAKAILNALDNQCHQQTM